ncbi:amino acid ABC transporter ATP-binding protein [Gordonia sp. GN26]
MIEFQNVHKSFGEVSVLNGLDLKVDTGEKLAIIGPSGSGKTTILRLLMGLERPTSGQILLDGELVWDEPGKSEESHLHRARRRMGFVFQHFNLFPHMTVWRNVAAGLLYTRKTQKDAARQRAIELLEMVGLADKADRYPSQLSGGQQQRVAIARALAMDPDVMLFDEPTSALDPELVGDVLRVIADVARSSNTTMLLVTHEMRFARLISDRVAFCDGGKVVELAPPEDLFTNPTHERTQRFLDSVLNPLDGTEELRT